MFEKKRKEEFRECIHFILANKMGNDKKPREMSWKKPVSKFRKMVDVGANKKFDPRFNPECGEFDAIEFQRNFEFIDELRSQEIKVRLINVMKSENQS